MSIILFVHPERHIEAAKCGRGTLPALVKIVLQYPTDHFRPGRYVLFLATAVVNQPQQFLRDAERQRNIVFSGWSHHFFTF